MKANLQAPHIEYKEIPDRYFVNGVSYTKYKNRQDQHFADGWRDVVVEPLNDNQKHAENVIENDKIVKKAVDLTEEEIEANKQQEADDFIKAFMAQKIIDGKAFADDMRFRITKELIGKPITQVNEIDSQLKKTAMPLVTLIEHGDYWSAMTQSFATSEPANEIALKYYNELKNHIIEYVQTNYPK